jgi:hypothetical protein
VWCACVLGETSTREWKPKRRTLTQNTPACPCQKGAAVLRRKVETLCGCAALSRNKNAPKTTHTHSELDEHTTTGANRVSKRSGKKTRNRESPLFAHFPPPKARTDTHHAAPLSKKQQPKTWLKRNRYLIVAAFQGNFNTQNGGQHDDPQQRFLTITQTICVAKNATKYNNNNTRSFKMMMMTVVLLCLWGETSSTTTTRSQHTHT